MRVRITLGVLCTATGRANPTFFGNGGRPNAAAVVGFHGALEGSA